MRPTRPISHETQCGGAPSGVLDLPGHATEETLDENLHYARAWHRYRYCYRHSEQLRILDAGCGTGRSTVDAARLNPAATVLGVDISEAALALAKGRAGAVGLPTVTFAIQDLATPMPDAWGEFGFVICRNVLGRAADPGTILGQLAKRLSPDGLLLATFPSQVGRQAPRALRQAVDAIAQKNASLAERTRIGMELVQALRPDHPLLNHVARARTSNNDVALDNVEGDIYADMKELARVVIDALIDEREWTFNEAAAQLEAAGLRLLYAATTLRWQLDRTFGPGPLPDTLLGPLDQMEPEALSRLIDALDPASLDKDYVLYACRARYEPVVPSWPRTRSNDDSSFDHLIPHLTGLGRPEKGLPATSAAQGRTLYRTVSGAIGELERIAVLRLAAVDGQSSCGDIDRKLASHTRASDDTLLRQECWVNLADSGLIVFEPPRIGLH